MLKVRKSILIKAMNTRMKRQAEGWADMSVTRVSGEGLSRTCAHLRIDEK